MNSASSRSQSGSWITSTDHAPAPQQVLLSPKGPVLADHDPGNAVEQNGAAAHGAGRERGVERAAPIHRRRQPAGPLQGVHLRVQDHAARLLPAVVTPAEDAFCRDEDRADRDAAFLEALAGFVESGLHEGIHVSADRLNPR